MARVVQPSTNPPATPRDDFGPKVNAHVRYQTKNGLLVPGVTTVVGIMAKPALVPWANRLGLQGIDVNKYVDEAATVGTLAHYLIECQLVGVEPELADFTPAQLERAQHGLDRFNQWLRQHELKVNLVEKPLVSETHLYGGTIDCFGAFDGVATLLDFKTSSDIYDEHVIQVGGYWRLLAEHGYRVKGVRILRIGRSEAEGFEEHVLTGPRVLTAWRIFEHCLELYRLRKQLKG